MQTIALTTESQRPHISLYQLEQLRGQFLTQCIHQSCSAFLNLHDRCARMWSTLTRMAGEPSLC